MSALLILIFVAVILIWALFVFLDAGRSTTSEDAVPLGSASSQSDSCDSREFAQLGNLVFSDQDWNLIRGEQSAALEKLFVKERRAVMTHWLLASSGRLHAIRISHLQTSRHSTNLDVFAEIRLLLLFAYLAFLCRSLLVVARFSRPSTPSVLAQHFRSAANRLFSTLPRVPAAEAPGQHLSPSA